jgi:hypothetical protein
MLPSTATRRQWGVARASLNADATPDALDQMIVWRMHDPRYLGQDNRQKEHTMMRQWTIEARADFADQDKNEAITLSVQQFAVALRATLVMIKDNNQSPQVVCYSDDFFLGHQDIALIKDTVGPAIADSGTEPADVSDEMMQAMRDIQHDKSSK